MKTYIKMSFSSEGGGPKKAIEILGNMGFTPVVGLQDFHIEWDKHESHKYLDKIQKMHEALQGLNIRYQLITER